MSTRSHVGVLDADGHTYHARYVQFDGNPDTTPYMVAAVWWQTFHRDTQTTIDALLSHDWQQTGPDITEHTATSLAGYRPVPGVGIALPATDEQPQPLHGDLAADAEPAAQWMYLIDLGTPGTLLILTSTKQWTVAGRMNMSLGRDVVVEDQTHRRPGTHHPATALLADNTGPPQRRAARSRTRHPTDSRRCAEYGPAPATRPESRCRPLRAA